LEALEDKPEPNLTSQERVEKLMKELKLDRLGEEQRAQAQEVLARLHHGFSLQPDEMGHTNAAQHDIVVYDEEAYRERFRRLPPPMVPKVRKMLDDMLQARIIKPSQSPWCNAVVLAKKKDGTLRFCVDFRRLNARTKKDAYPLPRITEVLESLAGCCYFSSLDLKAGFWQAELTERAKKYTAFTVGNLGFYEFERMPFGLTNAPATFQRLMTNCLGELNLTYCMIYLDDIIVYARTFEEHLHRLEVVIQRLIDHGLKLKPSKCDLFQEEITYLSHKVSKAGIQPSEDNLVPIAAVNPPSTYTEVRSFLGLVGHYRRFIKGFAKIARPLSDLLSGDGADKKKEQVT